MSVFLNQCQDLEGALRTDELPLSGKRSHERWIGLLRELLKPVVHHAAHEHINQGLAIAPDSCHLLGVLQCEDPDLRARSFGI